MKSDLIIASICFDPSLDDTRAYLIQVLDVDKW